MAKTPGQVYYSFGMAFRAFSNFMLKFHLEHMPAIPALDYIDSEMNGTSANSKHASLNNEIRNFFSCFFN